MPAGIIATTPTWEGFWTLIDLLGDPADCAYAEPLAEALAGLPPAAITGFAERPARASPDGWPPLRP